MDSIFFLYKEPLCWIRMCRPVPITPPFLSAAITLVPRLGHFFVSLQFFFPFTS